MATAYATLMDLPNELLAVIIHEISAEDRLSLAHLCRRLNHVALSYQFYEKHIPSYSSFGSHSRKFSDLRHLGLYLTTEPPFPVIELTFTGQFETEMAEVQHYLDTIPYDPPAFHVQFLAGKLYSSFWRPDILKHFSSFCQSLVRWKCLSLVVPAFEAHELDCTVSFDVPALTTLQMATFNWPKSDRLAEWFVQCINASPIEVLCISHEMVRCLPELNVRNLRHMKLLSSSVEAPVLSSFISRHAATLQILDCPSFFILPEPRPTLSLKSVPHLTSISGPTLLLLAVLSSTDAFPSLSKVDILKQEFLWRGSQHQTEEMRAVLRLISRIPSIRQLTAPLVDLIETALESPPGSIPAMPHIDCLISTEPWAAQEERDVLSRLFPNLTEHREVECEGQTYSYYRYFWPIPW
ncbi:hypothetical protein ARMSODRAFT_963790 [Armillaria solidipes]|uniref:F-box domain-containing protein n=1 Tax=Armillaria solidipes TaxID=1076256 RepID=A0A2H3BGI9_9AGAR|nr:hypothetical protein ARMSODRAFT_963790 [Armillaria solidipes]